MAKNKAEYKHVGVHVQDLADGRMVGPGETVDLSDEDVRDPHNELLIAEGIFIPTEEAEEPEATDAAIAAAKQANVSLTAITGTGSDGKITKEDVDRHVVEAASTQEGDEG